MTQSPPDFAPVLFSTRDLPEEHRIPIWREVFGRSLLRIDIEQLSVPFTAEATLRALPNLGLVSYSGSATRLQRSSAFCADAEPSVGLVVNFTEKAIMSQRGQDIALGPGDAVAALSYEPANAIFETGSYLGVTIPRAALSRVKNIEDHTMHLIRSDEEVLRLLVSYLKSLREEVVLVTPKLRRVVVDHVHDLVALALAQPCALGADRSGAVANARLKAAFEHIAASLHDPALSLIGVASRLGISPRYLQQLLEDTGTCFTDHVHELRLQRAFALLTDPRNKARLVSGLALDCGFSDISHFNRLFRSRFGDTPSRVRAQATEQHRRQ